MINEKMYGLGDEPSAIRELFAYGMARKAEIGAENVFDFSIGNPSVPAPELVRETMLELLDMDPVALHAYSPAAGLPEVKEAIAAYLSERYDTTATSGHLYLTAGAAAALASSVAAVTHPGDEVVVVSPYFPEYRTWIEAAGCTIVEVPAAVPSFQPDIEALRAGVGLIAQKFHEVLRSCGVSEIEAKGLELDTDHHEAVARFQAGEEQRGKIVDVVQKGYRLRDKVLRFAKVVVGE